MSGLSAFCCNHSDSILLLDIVSIRSTVPTSLTRKTRHCNGVIKKNSPYFFSLCGITRPTFTIPLPTGSNFSSVFQAMEVEIAKRPNISFALWLEHFGKNRSQEDAILVPEPPEYLLGIWTSLYIVVFVVGLLGNVAVTFVVLRCRSMHTFINFLFLNLCIADLLVLVISGPTAVVDMYAREVWYLGKFMCKLIPFLENVVGNASAVTILAISVERYRVACRTLTQSTASPSSMFKTSLLIWLTAILAALPFIFITSYTRSMFVDGTSVPVCKTPVDQLWHRVYIVLTTSLFFILPLLAIYVLYTKVCLKLITLFKTEQEKLQGYPREIVKLKRQMIQIIVTVVMVFFVCHTPYRALVLWSMFEDRRTLAKIDFESYLALFYMTRILLYSNHAINPFVYNFVSRKFRRALLWLCCERRRRVKKMEDWREYVHQRSSLRHHPESNGRTGAARVDVDNNLREREEMECVSRCPRYQRNDFLVLYENLMLLE